MTIYLVNDNSRPPAQPSTTAPDTIGVEQNGMVMYKDCSQAEAISKRCLNTMQTATRQLIHDTTEEPTTTDRHIMTHKHM